MKIKKESDSTSGGPTRRIFATPTAVPSLVCEQGTASATTLVSLESKLVFRLGGQVPDRHSCNRSS